MPQVIVTENAAEGLERCRRFLADKNPLAAVHAGQVIEKYLAVLETDLTSGRPVHDLPPMREMIIPFGDSGYVGLYVYDSEANTIYLLAFRHQKEAGY